MKFKSFRCSCGYVCISPADEPKCPDCGAPMILVTDEVEERKIDQALRPILEQLIGKPREVS